jgi:undecaprenyl pyrophosphate phosphatase UppP
VGLQTKASIQYRRVFKEENDKINYRSITYINLAQCVISPGCSRSCIHEASFPVFSSILTGLLSMKSLEGREDIMQFVR